jgi:hypothetical protein
VRFVAFVNFHRYQNDLFPWLTFVNPLAIAVLPEKFHSRKIGELNKCKQLN